MTMLNDVVLEFIPVSRQNEKRWHVVVHVYAVYSTYMFRREIKLVWQ